MRAHARCSARRAAQRLAAAQQAGLREQGLDGGGVAGAAGRHVVSRALLRLLQVHRGRGLLLASQLAQQLVQQGICKGEACRAH